MYLSEQRTNTTLLVLIVAFSIRPNSDPRVHEQDRDSDIHVPQRSYLYRTICCKCVLLRRSSGRQWSKLAGASMICTHALASLSNEYDVELMMVWTILASRA